MKRPVSFLAVPLLTLFLPFPILRAEEASPPKLVTLTLYVAGVECPACSFAVNDSVRRLDGVDQVDEGQGDGNYVNVTFDPSKVSVHQLAVAVGDAFPLHGAPYQASLRLRLPAGKAEGDSPALSKAFSKWKDWVSFECSKPGKGEWTLHFRPRGEDDAKRPSPGLRHDEILAIVKEAAGGPGDDAAAVFVSEGQRRS